MYFPQKWPSIGCLDALLAKTLLPGLPVVMYAMLWDLKVL